MFFERRKRKPIFDKKQRLLSFKHTIFKISYLFLQQKKHLAFLLEKDNKRNKNTLLTHKETKTRLIQENYHE